jgi:hypothetical protein
MEIGRYGKLGNWIPKFSSPAAGQNRVFTIRGIFATHIGSATQGVIKLILAILAPLPNYPFWKGLGMQWFATHPPRCCEDRARLVANKLANGKSQKMPGDQRPMIAITPHDRYHRWRIPAMYGFPLSFPPAMYVVFPCVRLFY